MPQFAVNGSSSPENVSEQISSKVKSSLEMTHLGSGTQDHDSSSSSQSTTQSQPDQISIATQTHIEGQVGPGYFIANPNFWTNPSQIEMAQSSIHVSNFGGIYTAYGPQSIVQQQMIGIAPGRVPLPVDLAEDSPMYVNAKQYHAILRRRQMRAKLEAQNKLVKTRKPYLHESRHVHALNRVRGSGGRFLSTKKTQNLETNPRINSSRSSDSVQFNQKRGSELMNHDGQSVVCYGITHNGSNGEVSFNQAEHRRFASMASHMVAVPLVGKGRGGGYMCTTDQRGVPVVR